MLGINLKKIKPVTVTTIDPEAFTLVTEVTVGSFGTYTTVTDLNDLYELFKDRLEDEGVIDAS